MSVKRIPPDANTIEMFSDAIVSSKRKDFKSLDMKERGIVKKALENLVNGQELVLNKHSSNRLITITNKLCGAHEPGFFERLFHNVMDLPLVKTVQNTTTFSVIKKTWDFAKNALGFYGMQSGFNYINTALPRWTKNSLILTGFMPQAIEMAGLATHYHQQVKIAQMKEDLLKSPEFKQALEKANTPAEAGEAFSVLFERTQQCLSDLSILQSPDYDSLKWFVNKLHAKVIEFKGMNVPPEEQADKIFHIINEMQGLVSKTKPEEMLDITKKLENSDIYAANPTFVPCPVSIK